MQSKTAQVQALKLSDVLKYFALSGFCMTTGIAAYFLAIA